jgi:putative transposase
MEKKAFSINTMCRVLKVSTSGYYKWLKGKNAPKKTDRPVLIERVKELHIETRGSYGARRISKQLREEGFNVGKYMAGNLMKEAGVSVKKKRKYVQTTDSDHSYPIAPNLLNRQFNPSIPNQVFAGDITYLSTEKGWAYLAVVIDLYSRRVVGWSVKETLSADIVEDALRMAVWRRKPQRGLIFHSDRGSQYASDSFRKLLRRYGMKQSMSRKANCWDNSPVEKFFGSLKTEWTDKQWYQDLDEVRFDVLKYIDMFYNSKRLHSTLGYCSPVAFEKRDLAA